MYLGKYSLNPYKWKDETGQLRAWTRGLVAERAFYEALQRVEELLSFYLLHIILY